MKHSFSVQYFSRRRRAFTGAWIETEVFASMMKLVGGRAFTGAWIETFNRKWDDIRPRGRAFTGAWIETGDELITLFSGKVAPSQARGLKLVWK